MMLKEVIRKRRAVQQTSRCVPVSLHECIAWRGLNYLPPGKCFVLIHRTSKLLLKK